MKEKMVVLINTRMKAKNQGFVNYMPLEEQLGDSFIRFLEIDNSFQKYFLNLRSKYSISKTKDSNWVDGLVSKYQHHVNRLYNSFKTSAGLNLTFMFFDVLKEKFGDNTGISRQGLTPLLDVSVSGSSAYLEACTDLGLVSKEEIRKYPFTSLCVLENLADELSDPSKFKNWFNHSKGIKFFAYWINDDDRSNNLFSTELEEFKSGLELLSQIRYDELKKSFKDRLDDLFDKRILTKAEINDKTLVHMPNGVNNALVRHGHGLPLQTRRITAEAEVDMYVLEAVNIIERPDGTIESCDVNKHGPFPVVLQEFA